MDDEGDNDFTTRQVEVLKKIANKRIAWGEVTADVKVWMTFLAAMFAFVALFRETILQFLGLR